MNTKIQNAKSVLLRDNQAYLDFVFYNFTAGHTLGVSDMKYVSANGVASGVGEKNIS